LEFEKNPVDGTSPSRSQASIDGYGDGALNNFLFHGICFGLRRIRKPAVRFTTKQVSHERRVHKRAGAGLCAKGGRPCGKGRGQNLTYCGHVVDRFRAMAGTIYKREGCCEL